MQVFELEIGDAIQIGDRILTVVDIDGDDVSVRIDSGDEMPLGFDELDAHAVLNG